MEYFKKVFNSIAIKYFLAPVQFHRAVSNQARIYESKSTVVESMLIKTGKNVFKGSACLAMIFDVSTILNHPDKESGWKCKKKGKSKSNQKGI